MSNVSRRSFLKAAGAGAAAAATVPGETLAQKPAPPHPHPAASPRPAQAGWTFFNPAEAAFVTAAVARLIPDDDTGPGAVQAGVPTYLDRQLGGAWGAGERLYRQGPWQPGTPTQGYQLPFTPAELFRTAIRAYDADVRKRLGTAFDALAPTVQDEELTALEKGTQDLDGVPASVFFETLLAMTVEGFWADPVYGGNRDMAGWKLIGFPGAHASFYAFVGPQNIEYRREPSSLAEDARGEVHVHPQIPATLRPGTPVSARSTKGR